MIGMLTIIHFSTFYTTYASRFPIKNALLLLLAEEGVSLSFHVKHVLRTRSFQGIDEAVQIFGIAVGDLDGTAAPLGVDAHLSPE